MTFRGSRKHVLDWAEHTDFVQQFQALLAPTPTRITDTSTWMPLGYVDPSEARLETFGPKHLPDALDWKAFGRWWLKHPAGANTPNWDLAATADVDGETGLILIEAKANVPELKADGKGPPDAKSAGSQANHEQIGAAIAEVRQALQAVWPGVAISRDTHYQLSNRIAFAWKLASMGLPTVLVYLGFTGDDGIWDAGEPFTDEDHWRDVFFTHVAPVAPPDMWDRPTATPMASTWMLVRARAVIERSPPPDAVVGRVGETR